MQIPHTPLSVRDDDICLNKNVCHSEHSEESTLMVITQN